MFPEFDEQENVLMESETSSPLPWTYRMDWETKQFMKGLDGRYIRTETYAEYLEEVARKILNTKRFKYAIYSENYGVDYFDHIGYLPLNVQLSLIKNEAQESLEAHKEIEITTILDIRNENKGIFFRVELEGVRGKTKVVIDIWNR